MKKNLTLLFSIVLLIQAQIKAQSKMTEFQLQTEAWKNAYNSGDATKLGPLYTEDAKYLSSHVSGLEAFGLENVLAYFQSGINSGGYIDSIRVISVEKSGSMAYLLTQYHATNSGQQVSGRNLLVLRRVRNKWLIAIHMTVV